jgi:hypothetical protein
MGRLIFVPNLIDAELIIDDAPRQGKSPGDCHAGEAAVDGAPGFPPFGTAPTRSLAVRLPSGDGFNPQIIAAPWH